MMLELKIDSSSLSSQEILGEIAQRKQEILKVQEGAIGSKSRLGWFNLPDNIDEYLAPIKEASSQFFSIL